MTTVVHNGQVLRQVTRDAKKGAEPMDLDAQIEAAQETIERLKAMKKASGEIAKTAEKWHKDEVSIEVILAGLKEAGYSLPSATPSGRGKRGGAKMGIDDSTAKKLVAHVQKLAKKDAQTVFQLRNALGLAKDAYLAPTLKAAIADKLIKTEGEKRGTKYFGA